MIVWRASPPGQAAANFRVESVVRGAPGLQGAPTSPVGWGRAGGCGGRAGWGQGGTDPGGREEGGDIFFQSAAGTLSHANYILP